MTETEDAISNLEDHVRRKDAEDKAINAITASRVKLVLAKDATACFFATLALKLKIEVSWDVPTMATNGKRLAINPDWVNNLKADECKGVVAHEVMHNAMLHHTRRNNRDFEKWNVACDLAINHILKDAGYKLTKEGAFPGEGAFRDMKKGLSAEEYYELLPPSPPDDGNGQGSPCSDPGGCGAVEDAGDGSPADQKEAAAQASVDVCQAHATAKQRGTLPGGLERLVQAITEPVVDWRHVLREFVTKRARNDYVMSPPNRRHLQQGICLPSMGGQTVGDLLIHVDSSGSTDQWLGTFAAELDGILQAYECALTIVYGDTKVQHIQHWSSGDGPITLESHGGGGTCHKHIFDWVDRQGEPPACMVCLTDCYTDYPSRAPDYPVLWAVVGNPSAQPPFGQVVQVK